MGRLQIAVVSVLGLVLAAAGGVVLHQSRKLKEVRQQRDSALQSLRESQEALHQSELRIASVMRQAPEQADNDKAAIAQRDATIEQLTNELNAAQAGITQLQEELSTSKDENAKALKSSSQRFQEEQTELETRLDQLQKQLTSAQADIQNSRQRIASLQKLNDQLNAANNQGAARTAEREHILSRLQDLDRRRESYLTSIADRYRNLTSQFRTMSGMLNSNRGQNSNALTSPALDLIQNAISLTDNDLQHLSELNAKAFRLEKELKKK
jgi:chromosome segregation ATPase